LDFGRESGRQTDGGGEGGSRECVGERAAGGMYASEKRAKSQTVKSEQLPMTAVQAAFLKERKGRGM